MAQSPEMDQFIFMLTNRRNHEAFKEHMRKQKGDNWTPHRVRYRPLNNG